MLRRVVVGRATAGVGRLMATSGRFGIIPDMSMAVVTTAMALPVTGVPRARIAGCIRGWHMYILMQPGRLSRWRQGPWL